jgi:hypothetical protein
MVSNRSQRKEIGMTRKILAAAVAALAVAGAGAAVAATGLGTPEQNSKAVVDDAAKQLGVDSTALSNALKKALQNRVDAAVAAGSITEVEGETLKARIAAEEYPLLGFGHHGGPGFGHHGGPGFGHHLAAAATYLGLSETELQTQLAGGKTLADVAKAQGKTVDGLVAALVADEKKELDAAVAAGRLTQAQANEMLANAEQRFTDLVNGTLSERGTRGFGGPPPAAAGASTAYAGPAI